MHKFGALEKMETVWIVDDDRSIRWVLEKALARESLSHRSFESADAAVTALSALNQPPKVLISDIRMPGASGLQLLETVKGRFPDLPVIIMTAYSDLDSAVSAFKGGALVIGRGQHIGAHHVNFARLRGLKAADGPQQHGFASTRAANDAEDFAPVDIKIKVLVNDMAAELVVQAADANDNVLVWRVDHTPTCAKKIENMASVTMTAKMAATTEDEVF